MVLIHQKMILFLHEDRKNNFQDNLILTKKLKQQQWPQKIFLVQSLSGFYFGYSAQVMESKPFFKSQYYRTETGGSPLGMHAMPVTFVFTTADPEILSGLIF